MKLYSLLLLSLALVACAPPYSAELNSSAGLARQMTLLGTIGPVNSPDGDSTKAIKFLPVKPSSTTLTIDALGVQSGFLVSQAPGRESLCFAFQDSGGNVQISNSNQGFPLAGADPNYPLYQYELLTPTTTTTANILVFKLDPTTLAPTVQLFTTDLATGLIQSPVFTPPPTNPQPLKDFVALGRPVLAAQAFPTTIAPYDQFNFLFDNGSPLDGEGTAPFDGATNVFGIPTSSNTNVQFPGTQKRVLYYNNGQIAPSILSYASYYEAGKWVCYRWTNVLGSTAFLSDVTHRIDAVLTNGDLISTQDATLRIYNPSGSEVLSVGCGALQFCYETYVNGTPYVFFSVSMGFPHNNWLFRVYAIPTSELRGLKG